MIETLGAESEKIFENRIALGGGGWWVSPVQADFMQPPGWHIQLSKSKSI